MNIGFIGSGRMGSSIIGRLMSAGHALSVFDVDPRATAGCASEGPRSLRARRERQGRCDLVFVCVPGPKEVEAVCVGADGVFPSARARDRCC